MTDLTDLSLFDGATPGPWHVEPKSWISGQGRKGRICDYGPTYGSPDAESVANARLIAAAPDLLAQVSRLKAENEALRAALEQMLCEDCPPVGYPTDKTRCTPCPRIARAALGEQGQ